MSTLCPDSLLRGVNTKSPDSQMSLGVSLSEILLACTLQSTSLAEDSVAARHTASLALFWPSRAKASRRFSGVAFVLVASLVDSIALTASRAARGGRCGDWLTCRLRWLAQVVVFCWVDADAHLGIRYCGPLYVVDDTRSQQSSCSWWRVVVVNALCTQAKCHHPNSIHGRRRRSTTSRKSESTDAVSLVASVASHRASAECRSTLYSQ